MEKLKFEFIIKSTGDPKTNTMCINSITDINNKTFLIPEELQLIKLHIEIMKTQTFKKIKTTLQKRHEKRQVWISLTPEIKNVYIDEDGNMQFNDYLLEDISPGALQDVPITEETLTKIMENFSQLRTDIYQSCNIKNLTDKFVLEKFTMKTSNVSQWISIFETECTRVGIEEDTKRIEALRLFLEDSCLDWYSSMLIKYTIKSDWSMWKTIFCETYSDQGWSPIRYLCDFF